VRRRRILDPIGLPLDFKYGGGHERAEAVTFRSYDPSVYGRCDAFAVAGCAGGRPLTEQTRAGETEAGVELRQRMARLIGGYQLSAAIGAVARLGVADALASGPAEPQDLAARVGADARSLERILRALNDAGLLTELDDGRIALTALGELLRSDAPMSARRAAIASTEEWRWRAYGHLTHSARTGEPGFPLGAWVAIGSRRG